jgi:alpha-galactosidase
MPNQGQITNLPKDAIVETLATVNANGITPKPSGELPGAIGSICRLHVDVHELTVRAALEGSRDLLVQALTLDPLSAGADFSEIGDLADDLLLANREWLPRFFD